MIDSWEVGNKFITESNQQKQYFGQFMQSDFMK